MAKSGSIQWYKDKYEAAVERLDKAKADIKALKEQIGNAPTVCEVQVDTSKLTDRSRASVAKFFHQAERCTNATASEIAAACIVHLADGTRRVPVQGLMGLLKRMKGTGLGR